MRAPINTAIWFLIWFLLVGWVLLYRSCQTDTLAGRVEPAVLPSEQPQDQPPQGPQAMRGVPIEASANNAPAPKRVVPKVDKPPAGAMSLQQVVKLLSLHLWEGVYANERLDTYVNETHQRQTAVLALRLLEDGR